MSSTTQPFVVASFHDRAEARAARERLAESGIAEQDLTLHQDTPDAANTTALHTDEMVTGGIVAAFGHLLDGLMSSAPPSGDAATYRELVKREGTLLTVKVADRAAGDAVKARLEEAGAGRVAVLPQPGLG